MKRISRFGVDDVQDCGWVITKDHFEESDNETAVGITGPGEVPDAIQAQLERIRDGLKVEKGWRSNYFTIRDDDNMPCASGYLVWPGAEEPSEDTLYAPLGDYGIGGYGATEVRYTGHKEWTIEG